MPIYDGKIIAFQKVRPPKAKPSSALSTTTPMRILLIEDSPEDRMFLRSLLPCDRFVLEEAHNGATGVASAIARPPDCILLDFHLPDYDGLEIIEKLRSSNGHLASAIVMLTASINITQAKDLLQAGALDYISKDYLQESQISLAITSAVERFRLICQKQILSDENDRLAAAADASSDAIVSIDQSYFVRTWSRGAVELFGYSETEALGRQLDELINPHLPNNFDQTSSIPNGNVSLAFISDVIRFDKTGLPLDVEVSVAPMFDKAGAHSGYSLAFRDQRARRAAEREIQEAQAKLAVSQIALRESDARLEMAWEVAPGGAWHWDVLHNMATVSKSYRELYGYSDSETIDFETWVDSIHPNDRARVTAYNEQQLATGERYEVQFRIIRRDGAIRWIDARGRCDRDKDGRATKLIGINLDITDQKQAADALLRSEKQLAAIFANIPLGVGMLDTTGFIMSKNERLNRYFETNRPCVEEADRWLAYDACGERIAFDMFPGHRALRGEASAECDFRFRENDGRETWARVLAAPMRDISDAIFGAVIVVDDIESAKRAETELQQKEALLKAVTDHARVGLARVNLNGRFTFANPTFLDIVGCSDVVGQLPQIVLPVAIYEKSDSQIAEALRGTRVCMDAGWSKVTGELVHYEITLEPELNDSKKVLGLTIVAVDITERKRHEAHIKILMEEVKHRAKNLLGVVQAITLQSAFSDAEKRISSRIGSRVLALSKSLDLLIADDWKGVALRSLIQGQLEPFQHETAQRVFLNGPHIFLSASAAQTIGMAVHELATNASKYGALSSDVGYIKFEWKLEEIAGARNVRLTWSEHDGPAVIPPKRRGFGYTVIDRLVKNGLNASVACNYEKSGFVWDVSFPQT